LKEKFDSESNITQKIKLLTLVPVHWTIEETMKEFKTTQYIVRQARSLKESKGILGERSLGSNNSKKITSEIAKQIVEFYEDDSNSRLLPGAKDYISVNTCEGRKHIQKRLILCNLTELHQKWLEESGQKNITKIGLTSFALLRPSHCIFAGRSGTHTVCVCIHHQNPNLMLKALNKPKLALSNMMSLAVCSLDDRKCMFHECQHCPGIEKIEMKVRELVSNITNNEISFKQWIMTDRCSLVTIVKNLDEFIEELTSNLFNLTIHHYVSKCQADFLATLKENLKPEEAILQMDFAENYTFQIQDEVQSSYFSKQQATLHPFVLYVRTPEAESENLKLSHKCYCVISDHLTHNTEAVHYFLSKLLPLIKSEFP
jgi:hypothetical protein